MDGIGVVCELMEIREWRNGHVELRKHRTDEQRQILEEGATLNGRYHQPELFLHCDGLNSD